MGIKVWFSEQDLEFQRFATKRVPAHKVVQKDVLFFHFRGDTRDLNGNALQLDEPATERHKTDYKKEYGMFLAAKEEMAKAAETPDKVEPLEAEEPKLEESEDGQG